MNTKRMTFIIGFFMVISLLLSGCGSTSPYALKCDIGTEQYSLSIEGETGEVTVQSNNESSTVKYNNGAQESITVNVNRTLTYKETGHEYTITGTIAVDLVKNAVTYDITATGDSFENKEQGCKNP